MLRYGSLQLYKKCISKNVVKNAVILNLHIITNILRIPWKEFSDQFIFNSYTCFQKNSQTYVIMIYGSTILNLMEFYFVIYSSIIIFIRRKSQNYEISEHIYITGVQKSLIKTIVMHFISKVTIHSFTIYPPSY